MLLADHPLQSDSVPDATWLVTCDICSAMLQPSAALYTCATCQFDVCNSCIQPVGLATSALRSFSLSQTLPAFPEIDYDDEVADDCCRLAKPPVIAGARRTGRCKLRWSPYF